MELGAGRCAEGEHLGGVEEGLAAGSRSLYVVPVQTSDGGGRRRFVLTRRRCWRD